jgi:hypothetical protein
MLWPSGRVCRYHAAGKNGTPYIEMKGLLDLGNRSLVACSDALAITWSFLEILPQCLCGSQTAWVRCHARVSLRQKLPGCADLDRNPPSLLCRHIVSYIVWYSVVLIESSRRTAERRHDRIIARRICCPADQLRQVRFRASSGLQVLYFRPSARNALTLLGSRRRPSSQNAPMQKTQRQLL